MSEAASKIAEKNIVVREAKGYRYETVDEIFRRVDEARNATNSSINFRIEAPSSQALMSTLAYLRVRVQFVRAEAGAVGRGNWGFSAIQNGNPVSTADAAAVATEDILFKKDAFALQCGAIENMTLGINSAQVSLRPNKFMRQFLLMTMGKSAMKEEGCPWFDFREVENEIVAAAGGVRTTATLGSCLCDEGECILRNQVRMEALSRDRTAATGGMDCGYGGGALAGARDNLYVTFCEPLFIGPLSPVQQQSISQMNTQCVLNSWSNAIPRIEKLTLDISLASNLAQTLMCFGNNSAHASDQEVSANVANAQLLTTWYLPPASAAVNRIVSAKLPTWDTTLFEQNIGAVLSNNTAQIKISYFTLQSMPSYFILAAKPIYNKLEAVCSSSAAMPDKEQWIRQKVPTLCIENVKLQVNTSQHCLNTESTYFDWSAKQLHKLTKANCVPAAEFPYSNYVFEKYRNCIILSPTQLSSLAYGPAVQSQVSLSGTVTVRNNTGFNIGANNYELIFAAVYLNKMMVISQSGADVRSIEFSAAQGQADKVGSAPAGAGYMSRF